MNGIITKITVGILYNLGNYEHVRYELTVDVLKEESASEVIIAIEKILAGLRPMRSVLSEEEIARRQNELAMLRNMSAVEFDQQYGYLNKSARALIDEREKSLIEEVEKRKKAKDIAAKARQLFDDLGGAAKWTDAKLDWECDYD